MTINNIAENLCITLRNPKRKVYKVYVVYIIRMLLITACLIIFLNPVKRDETRQLVIRIPPDDTTVYFPGENLRGFNYTWVSLDYDNTEVFAVWKKLCGLPKQVTMQRYEFIGTELYIDLSKDFLTHTPDDIKIKVLNSLRKTMEELNYKYDVIVTVNGEFV